MSKKKDARFLLMQLTSLEEQGDCRVTRKIICSLAKNKADLPPLEPPEDDFYDPFQEDSD